MTKQKKPKTGDVVGWVVVTASGRISPTDCFPRRESARKAKDNWDYLFDQDAPHRLAKIVLAK